MLYEFFLFGGIWFWSLVALECLILVLFLERENGAGATISVLLVSALLFFFGDFSPFAWLKANALLAVLYVAGYFIAGTVWSVVKWYFHCLGVRDRVAEIKQDFLKSYKLSEGSEIPDSNKKDWFNYLSQCTNYEELPPKAIRNKSRILMWMTYWPFSAAWTLINDPIKRTFKFIFERISSSMQYISNRVFKDFSKDLEGYEEDKF